MNRTLPQNPIFVVGYPRSGTTLLQSLLATQPGIETFPETHFFPLLDRVGISVDDVISEEDLAILLSKIARIMDFEFEDPRKSALSELAKEGQLTPKILFESIVAAFIGKRLDGTRRWLEKTPWHSQYIDQILQLYPEAQIINMIRSPVHSIYSAKTKIPALGSWSIAFHARRWTDSVRTMEILAHERPDVIRSVRYEDLAENPIETLVGIGQFLNFPLDLERLAEREVWCRDFILPVETWKASVAEPIYNRNNQEIPLLDILRIQNIVREQMRTYGYKCSVSWLQSLYDWVVALMFKASGMGAFRMLKKNFAAQWLKREILER